MGVWILFHFIVSEAYLVTNQVSTFATVTIDFPQELAADDFTAELDGMKCSDSQHEWRNVMKSFVYTPAAKSVDHI